MTPSRFDLLAPFYETLEWMTFGRLLHECRVAHLKRLGEVRNVLILGEGDGRFLAAFLSANTQAKVEVVDSSRGMIELARRRIASVPGHRDRVRWRLVDARRLQPDAARYDLIITHFFLDCFPAGSLDDIVERLALALGPGGYWLVGDFALPQGRVPRMMAQLTLLGMYTFFRTVTSIPAGRLADPHPLLRGQGLEIVSRWQSLGGFLDSTLWRKSLSGENCDFATKLPR